ncbi:MAG: protein kinase domain-containing protein [Persicimonas sp.]
MSESESDSIVSPGTILAERYKLTEEIGRGGFGMVYRARQINMDRDVAIKILPPKFMSIPDVAERFRREARLASRLRHPNTITVHDYGKQENLLFIVMELLEGEDLADLLFRKAALSMDRILHIGRQVLKSLHEAHGHKIVHRDLKPENIFLTDMGGEEDFVKVLDFGIAKLAMPEMASDDDRELRKLTMSGSTVGTPTYMSPEQAAGEEVDGLTDLYALGVILYEMACGRPPFKHDNPVKVMRSHLFEEVPRFPEGPLRDSRFEWIIRKALSKDKTMRFASPHEFLEALEASPTQMLEHDFLDQEPPTIELPGTDDESLDSDSLAFERTASYDVESSDEMSPRSPHSTDAMLAARTSSANDSEESIPFGTVPEQRDRVPEGAPSSSSLTETSGLSSRSDLHGQPSPSSPPAGFHSRASSSSIITVLEPGPDDEVILLTNKKEESADGDQTDAASLSTDAPGDAPLQASPTAAGSTQSNAPTSGERLDDAPTTDSGPRGGEWSWGQHQQSQQADDSDGLDAFEEFEPSSSGRTLLWVVVLLVLAAAGAAAYLHYSGQFELF